MCTREGEDLGLTMIRAGWATVYRTYTAGRPQEDACDAAEREARRGIWAKLKG